MGNYSCCCNKADNSGVGAIGAHHHLETETIRPLKKSGVTFQSDHFNQDNLILNETVLNSQE